MTKKASDMTEENSMSGKRISDMTKKEIKAQRARSKRNYYKTRRFVQHSKTKKHLRLLTQGTVAGTSHRAMNQGLI